jgi:riboflavin kinase
MNYIIATLKALALRGAGSQFVSVSTRELGKELEVSQQTASNRLVAMAKLDLIKRRRAIHGQDIYITKEGMGLLRKELADYQRIFSASTAIKLSGIVASGLGEGQYYLNKPGYRNQIMEKLGFAPFDGTLNLKVTENEMAKLSMVPASSRIKLDSFQADGRTYGEAECIPVEIQKVQCAIIVPKRSHHTEVLEIISAVHLRTKLELKDGDSVTVIVES